MRSIINMLRAFALIVTLTAVSLIESKAPVIAQVSTPPIPSLDQLSAYGKQGSSFVEGRLQTNTRLFGTLSFANAKVSLVPYTPYGLWFVRQIGQGLDHNSTSHPYHYPESLNRYTRDTVTDENGYFIFRGLPPGKYLLVAMTQKEVGDRPIERRTESAVDMDGNYVSVPVPVRGLAIRSETDAVAATAEITDGRGARIEMFDIVGASTCCAARV